MGNSNAGGGMVKGSSSRILIRKSFPLMGSNTAKVVNP